MCQVGVGGAGHKGVGHTQRINNCLLKHAAATASMLLLGAGAAHGMMVPPENSPVLMLSIASNRAGCKEAPAAPGQPQAGGATPDALCCCCDIKPLLPSVSAMLFVAASNT